MARKLLDVWIRLDRVHCHDEGDGWGSAEPYLWPVFFKIDGSTVRLNEALNLEGTATVEATYGAHGNLINTDVDEGENVPVPASVGSWQTRLTPIPVPDSLTSLVEDVAGVAGVVVVLMEEDNVSDSGALAGYNALVNEIQQRLNVLIPKLGFTHQEVTEEDIAALEDGIGDAVSSAVQGAQSALENFWSWLNADDQIGSHFFSFSHDTLADGAVHNFSKRWKNEGDWEIFGHANASEVCPASAAAALSEAFRSAFGSTRMRSLRRFRDEKVVTNPGLARWWGLAERNSAALTHLLLTDAQAREAMLAVVPRVSELLADDRATLPEDVVAQARVVLQRAAASPSRRLRGDAALGDELLKVVPGRTVSQAVALGTALEPSRRLRRAQVERIVARVVAAGGTGPVIPERPERPGRRGADR